MKNGSMQFKGTRLAFAALSALTSVSAVFGARTSNAEPGLNQTPPLASCTGCVKRASSVHVVETQSTQYGTEALDRAFSKKLTECYRKAGWAPEREKQLDYLVGYDATSGRVTEIKGAMFGTQPSAELLGCVRKALIGVAIGKVRKDREVHGFSMTVIAAL
jgi:hypothetical protein